MKVSIEITPPSLPRRRRARLVAAAALGLALVLPATVLASHIFTDVPTSMSGHNAISAVAGARITVGCTATTYCPTASVTREQMAIFLQRGLSRVTGAQDLEVGELSDVDATQNTMTLLIGGNVGGTQFVKADASFTGTVDDATGCPCTIFVYIRTNSGWSSEGTGVTVNAEGWYSGADTLTFPANTGTTETIFTTASRTGTGVISIYTDMSAISGAFGSTGTDVAGAPTGTGKRAQ
jgi:hypothetical protein